ncbi:MAG: hypothetical protein JWM27_3232 [Gemmatimonadetes bacterium]|nr:hypothetical protein [Gemmatimonadota bacterium]
MPPSSYQPAAPPVSVLRIIRGALAAAPVLLGCVGLWKWHGHAVDPAEHAMHAPIGIVAYALCVAAVGAVLAFRGIRARQEPAVRATYSLIGWAFAEAAAMLGGVYLLLDGTPWPWVLGLMVVAFSWMQIPADPAEV